MTIPTPPRRAALLVALAALLAAGCATQRPVLYPNAHLDDMGPEVAKYDVDRCIEFAREFAGRGSKSAEAAEQAAKGAVRGGATGAATSSIVGSLFRSRQLDPIERRFVETCLAELGYKPAGWR